MSKRRKMVLLLYHARHHASHQCIGLIIVLVLQAAWHTSFGLGTFLLMMISSEIIDLDHILYIRIYGRKGWYGKRVNEYITKGQWIIAAKFISENHKKLTSIVTHTLYMTLAFGTVAYISYLNHILSMTIICSGIFFHLVFDMVDDILMQGHLNENWFRLIPRPAPAKI